jgi:hypothetical protein
MPKLHDGWTQLQGVSGAGWDIWAGTSPYMPEGSRFAMFRRRIAEEETYTRGLIYPTLTQVQAAIYQIRLQFERGKYQFEDLFPNEVIIDHPNFGAF